MTHEEFSFAEPNDELGLTPEPEEIRPLAPDEPFSPNMILVPVVCDVCKLLIYAQEKHIGLWVVCPDCERLTRICAVDPLSRFVVKVGETGALEICRAADSVPMPVQRVNADYRTVAGSLDLGAEPIPFYGLDQSSDDGLENMMDRFLKTKSVQTETDDERRFAELSRRDEENKRRREEIARRETAEERRKRLIRELDTTRARRSPSTPNRTSKNDRPALRPQSASTGTPPPVSNAPSVDRSDRREVPFGDPWRHFFRPFFDKANSRRFQILYGSGVLSMVTFFCLYHYVVQLFTPGSDVFYSFTLFFTQYLLTFIPLAIWGVIVILNVMTIFSETRDGFNEIHRWILFRVEYATQYLFWLFVLGWIAPLAGFLLGAIFDARQIVFVFYGVNLLGWVPLGAVSMFFFFPILLLSIAENDKGLEIYHRTVWRSLIFRPKLWLTYYFYAFLIAAALLALGIFTVQLIRTTFEYAFISMSIFYIVAGAAIPFFVLILLHVWFRLLGALAWSIHQDGEKGVAKKGNTK